MTGRHKIEYKEHFMEIEVETSNGTVFTIKGIKIICPTCDSENTRENGTRKRKNTRVQAFMCANENCRDVEAEKSKKMDECRHTCKTTIPEGTTELKTMLECDGGHESTNGASGRTQPKKNLGNSSRTLLNGFKTWLTANSSK
jgi:hypothetical protein